MKIRKAEMSDLAEIVQIEELCFPEETAFPPRMFAYLIRYSVSLVACDPEEKVVGFIMGYPSGNRGAVYTWTSILFVGEGASEASSSWL